MPLIGDPSFADDAVFAMDRWLARVDADDREVPLARKIIQDRPDSVAARCTDGAGAELAVDGLRPDRVRLRHAAHGRRRPADRGRHEVPAQAAAARRTTPSRSPTRSGAQLQQAFPTGVCDYSKPGVDQRGAIPWLTYQDKRGRVVYGGKPLGDPPLSHRVKPPRR